MFCIYCGKKIDNNVEYCPYCGSHLDNKNKKLDINIDFKRLKKVIFDLSIVVIIVFLITTSYKLFFSEDAVVRKWTTAYALNDYNTVIRLSNIKKNKFMKSKVIERKYGKETIDSVDVKILSSAKGLKHNKTVSYKVGNKTKLLNIVVNNKLFKYSVEYNDLIANDVKIIAPKDYEVYVDDVLLGSDEIVKNEKNNTIYKIDSLLKKNVSIKVKVNNNIIIEDVKSVFSKEEIDVMNLKYSDIENSSSFVELSDKIINDLVNNINSNNDFSKLNKELYSDSILEDEVFKNNYQNMKEKYNDNKNIKYFKIEDTKINNIKLLDNKKIQIKYNFNYKYGDTKTHNRSRTYIITLDENLKIVDININNLLYMF